MVLRVKPKKVTAAPIKPLEFLGSSRDDLAAMPATVRHDIGIELMRVQFGGLPTDFKPMSTACLPEEDAANYKSRYRSGQSPLQDDWSKVMSKKTDPRLSDTRRIKGSGNVFLDLGFDPAEAKIMAMRAEVMIRMEQHLKAQGWTQAEAAKRLGITQPRVSRLTKGRWQDFSLDMLLTLAARAGLEPTLRLAA